MTLPILPSMVGLSWSVHRKPTWYTLKQDSVGGQTPRFPMWSAPRWQYELTFEVLRSDAAPSGGAFNDWQTLVGFYNSVQGPALYWQFNDPLDATATAQQFGVTDGVTAAFQLARSMGGVAEPVYLPTVTDVKVGGVVVPPAGFSPPAAPSLSQVAGGALAATTYFVKTTYVTSTGETAVSSEQSLAVSVNNVLRVASPASQPGAVGWNVYVGTSSGTETKQNVATISIGTPFTEPTSGLVAGASPPASDKSGYALGSTGVVTFRTAPTLGNALVWDGTYNWMCQFDDDSQDFEQFARNFWKLGKIAFTTVKL